MTARRGPKEWAEIRILAALLARTVKAARLYPPAHDARRRLTDEAFPICQKTLARVGAVVFTVEPMRLVSDANLLLESVDREDPIPGRLWTGGIRELTLEPNLTADELHEFMLCFYHAEHALAGGEDDLATLLWVRDLRSIRHRGEALSADTRATVLPDELLNGVFECVDTELHDPTSGEGLEQFCHQTLEHLKARVSEQEPDLFVVSETEAEALRGELLAEEEPGRSWSDLCGLLRTVVLAERDSAALRSLLQLLIERFHALLTEGSLAAAADLATILGQAAERAELDPDAHAEIHRTLSLELEPGVFSALVRQLDAPDGPVIAELEQLCRALPAHAIASLCEILGQLETSNARYRLIDSLIPMATDHIDRLSPFLRDSRWYLVRNVALILGEIGNAEAIDSLRIAMRHEEPRVRKEVLKAVGQLGGYKARGILTHALRDRDPALRTWAARTLATLGNDGAAPLREILEEKDFARREAEEQRAFYEAYAYAAREEAVPYLAALLEPRGLFRARGPDSIRIALLEALGWAGGPAAVAILQGQRQDRSLEVRAAAENGLARALTSPDARGEMKAA